MNQKRESKIKKRKLILTVLVIVVAAYSTGYYTGKNTAIRLNNAASVENSQTATTDPTQIQSGAAQTLTEQGSIRSNGTDAKRSQASSNTTPATTPSSSPVKKPTCNRDSYQKQYDESNAFEARRHETEINRIADYWSARNAYNSSWREREEENENAKHSSNLAGIKTKLSTQLRDNNCS